MVEMPPPFNLIHLILRILIPWQDQEQFRKPLSQVNNVLLFIFLYIPMAVFYLVALVVDILIFIPVSTINHMTEARHFFSKRRLHESWAHLRDHHSGNWHSDEHFVGHCEKADFWDIAISEIRRYGSPIAEERWSRLRWAWAEKQAAKKAIDCV